MSRLDYAYKNKRVTKRIGWMLEVDGEIKPTTFRTTRSEVIDDYLYSTRPCTEGLCTRNMKRWRLAVRVKCLAVYRETPTDRSVKDE